MQINLNSKLFLRGVINYCTANSGVLLHFKTLEFQPSIHTGFCVVGLQKLFPHIISLIFSLFKDPAVFMLIKCSVEQRHLDTLNEKRMEIEPQLDDRCPRLTNLLLWGWFCSFSGLQTLQCFINLINMQKRKFRYMWVPLLFHKTWCTEHTFCDNALSVIFFVKFQVFAVLEIGQPENPHLMGIGCLRTAWTKNTWTWLWAF